MTDLETTISRPKGTANMTVHITPRLFLQFSAADPRLRLNGFEIGRTYPARPANAQGPHFTVTTANGWERFVLSDGDGGAHLTILHDNGRAQTAGYFESTREEPQA